MIISSVPTASVERDERVNARGLHPLVTVMRWELRRLLSARSTWILAGLVFALSCVIEWALAINGDAQTLASDFGPRTITVDWLSNYGLLHTLPTYLGVVLALFIPFVCTDGVAIDVKRRTHELLMSSAIPSWAYLWGRYLSNLLMSLGLAVVMLLAILTVAVSRTYIQPDIAVAPDLLGIGQLWALIFLPVTVVLSTVCFALGTLWPQRTTLIKAIIVLGWLMEAPVIHRMDVRHNLAVWDITSQAAAEEQSTGSVLQQFAQRTQHMGNAEFLASWHALQQQLPDMSAWIGPRLIWIAFGFACLLLVTLAFRRFGDIQA